MQTMIEKMFDNLWFYWCQKTDIEANKTETSITVHIWGPGVERTELILFSDGTWRIN